MLRRFTVLAALLTGVLAGGTALTVTLAEQVGKPCLVVDLNENPDPVLISEWLRSNRIRVLNVGGPRESESPGISVLAIQFLRSVFGLARG